ncbi:hypothetical protein GCM10027414_06580 [Humibacter ginsengiterrae]
MARAARARADALIGEAKEGDRFAILWAAGAAVTAATQFMIQRELDELAKAFTEITDTIASVKASVCFFYASSAGGVYAGSQQPPFSERTVPAPISPYGEFKLAAEQLVEESVGSIGASSVVGRIANLYGPGQRMDKMQGLISHLALAQFSPSPASIFVPLDTLRDYIYVDDCADLILDTMSLTLNKASQSGAVSATKVMATGHAASIAELLGHFSRLSHGHPNVMVGSSPVSAFQARDLRLRSEVWPALDQRQMTPLPVGIKATIDDILRMVQAGAIHGRH